LPLGIMQACIHTKLVKLAKNWSIDQSHYKKTSHFAGLFNISARPWKKILHFRGANSWEIAF
jgi:hypothetical protein